MNPHEKRLYKDKAKLQGQKMLGIFPSNEKKGPQN